MRMRRTTIEEKYELIRKLSFITENYSINPWQYIKEYIKKGKIFQPNPEKKNRWFLRSHYFLCGNVVI